MKNLILVIFIVAFFASCENSFQLRRKYTIEKCNETFRSPRNPVSSSMLCATEYRRPFLENSHHLFNENNSSSYNNIEKAVSKPNKYKLLSQPLIPVFDCPDTIVKNDGGLVICKIVERFKKIYRFTVCDSTNQSIWILKTKDIYRVISPNIMFRYYSKEEVKIPKKEKKRSLCVKIALGFLISILTLLVLMAIVLVTIISTGGFGP